MVRISIIMPTCDRPGLLRDAVGSVSAQEFADWELIIVDDGHDPVSLSIRDPRVRVLRTAGRSGPAAARNIGLSAATGEVVTFLDDDDAMAPGRLRAIDRAHRSGRIAVCDARFMDADRGRGRRVEGDVEHCILDGPTPSLGRTSVDREIVPRFDEQWRAVEDVEWWLRLAPRAPVVVIDGLHYLVRRHDGPRVVNSLAARLEENQRFLEAHPYFQTHAGAAAYRWRRLGMLARSTGDPALAVAFQLRSLRIQPSARSFGHLCRGILALGRAWATNRSHPESQWTEAATTTSGRDTKK